ncbi:MAG TPA: hypothetical protein VGE18_01445 [Candidatus Paceibacterota bacterium]
MGEEKKEPIPLDFPEELYILENSGRIALRKIIEKGRMDTDQYYKIIPKEMHTIPQRFLYIVGIIAVYLNRYGVIVERPIVSQLALGSISSSAKNGFRDRD